MKKCISSFLLIGLSASASALTLTDAMPLSSSVQTDISLAHPDKIVLYDANNDGFDDIIYLTDNNYLYLIENDSDRNEFPLSFKERELLLETKYDGALFFGDFDGDGTQELLQTADGDFSSGINVIDLRRKLSNQYTVASIGDYNGDGRSDVLVYDRNNYSIFYSDFDENSTSPSWKYVQMKENNRRMSTNLNPTNLLSGDYDSDGNDEIVFYVGEKLKILNSTNVLGEFESLTYSGEKNNIFLEKTALEPRKLFHSKRLGSDMLFLQNHKNRANHTNVFFSLGDNPLRQTGTTTPNINSNLSDIYNSTNSRLYFGDLSGDGSSDIIVRNSRGHFELYLSTYRNTMENISGNVTSYGGFSISPFDIAGKAYHVWYSMGGLLEYSNGKSQRQLIPSGDGSDISINTGFGVTGFTLDNEYYSLRLSKIRKESGKNQITALLNRWQVVNESDESQLGSKLEPALVSNSIIAPNNLSDERTLKASIDIPSSLNSDSRMSRYLNYFHSSSTLGSKGKANILTLQSCNKLKLNSFDIADNGKILLLNESESNTSCINFGNNVTQIKSKIIETKSAYASQSSDDDLVYFAPDKTILVVAFQLDNSDVAVKGYALNNYGDVLFDEEPEFSYIHKGLKSGLKLEDIYYDRTLPVPYGLVLADSNNIVLSSIELDDDFDSDEENDYESDNYILDRNILGIDNYRISSVHVNGSLIGSTHRPRYVQELLVNLSGQRVNSLILNSEPLYVKKISDDISVSNVIGYIEGPPPVPMENFVSFPRNKQYAVTEVKDKVEEETLLMLTNSYGGKFENENKVLVMGFGLITKSDAKSKSSSIISQTSSNTLSQSITANLKYAVQCPYYDGFQNYYLQETAHRYPTCYENTGVLILEGEKIQIYAITDKSNNIYAYIPKPTGRNVTTLKRLDIDYNYLTVGVLDGQVGPIKLANKKIKGDQIIVDTRLNYLQHNLKENSGNQQRYNSDFTSYENLHDSLLKHKILARKSEEKAKLDRLYDNRSHLDILAGTVPYAGQFFAIGSGNKVKSVITQATDIPQMISNTISTTGTIEQESEMKSVYSSGKSSSGEGAWQMGLAVDIKVTANALLTLIEMSKFESKILAGSIWETKTEHTNKESNTRSIKNTVDAAAFTGDIERDADGDALFPCMQQVDTYNYQTIYHPPTKSNYTHLIREVIDKNRSDITLPTTSAPWRVSYTVGYVSRILPMATQCNYSL